MKQKKGSSKKIIMTTLILYTIWVVIYLACIILKLPWFQQPQEATMAVSLSFITACLICTIMVVVAIEKFKYIPFILLAVFILSGRLISFTGAFLFMQITGKTLFLLPFGSIDFFLFYFLSIGIFSFIRKEHKESPKTKFSILFILPVFLFAIPVYIHLIEESFSFVSIYSFVFTSLAVTAMITALVFRKVYPDKHLMTFSIIIAILIDLLIYLKFTFLDQYVPLMLNYLLLPYALFIFSYAVIRPPKEKAND